jgi:hypothetical protein
VLGVSSFSQKNDRRFKLLMAAGCFAYIIHFYLLGKPTAVASSTMSLLRSGLSLHSRSKWIAFAVIAIKRNSLPFKRPKDDTVLLPKHVLRYEPFWHVVTTRSVDYSRELVYPVEIGNAYANKILINGQEYSIAEQGSKRTISLQAVE